MIRRSSRSSLFPYTTLFRSIDHHVDFVSAVGDCLTNFDEPNLQRCLTRRKSGRDRCDLDRRIAKQPGSVLDERGVRSEEHTSELQSLAYVVCRTLPEKKKYY